ncbi:hypothetical protein PFLUV_G00150880 [Perca fluviatilis]|uniref:MADF domain-containing protein n=2 Tax=Perca fluviatilis TaxID=8168 RepID=A0A6A5ELI8_PERFL|nr:hypothetical protein PFLUV_G00150880 [Perca fluviatilis]
MAKKWDNLKRRYKDLKYPPVGMENVADSSSSWPWFHLMNEAMEGRLATSAPLLTPVTHDDEQYPDPAPRHRARATAAAVPPPPTSHTSSDYAQEVFADSRNDSGGALGGGESNQRLAEACDGALEREWEMVERERAALEREREMVDRDRAALERERAAVQAERLWLERERAAVERDRAMVEQERAALDQRALMMNSVGHAGHLNALM